MTPPQDPPRGQSRPRSASPAERSIEFAATQDRLKQEAAERRAASTKRTDTPSNRRMGTPGEPRRRG
jgi:hypothetical protein